MSFLLQVLKFACALAKLIYYHSLKGKTICYRERTLFSLYLFFLVVFFWGGCLCDFYFFLLLLFCWFLVFVFNPGLSWQNYMQIHPEHTKLLHTYYGCIVDFPKHISFTMHFLWMSHGQILHSWMSRSLGKYSVQPGLGERKVLREDFCGCSAHIGASTWGP